MWICKHSHEHPFAETRKALYYVCSTMDTWILYSTCIFSSHWRLEIVVTLENKGKTSCSRWCCYCLVLIPMWVCRYRLFEAARLIHWFYRFIVFYPFIFCTSGPPRPTLRFKSIHFVDAVAGMQFFPLVFPHSLRLQKYLCSFSLRSNIDLVSWRSISVAMISIHSNVWVCSGSRQCEMSRCLQ